MFVGNNEEEAIRRWIKEEGRVEGEGKEEKMGIWKKRAFAATRKGFIRNLQALFINPFRGSSMNHGTFLSQS
jgi:hypothetical protein